MNWASDEHHVLHQFGWDGIQVRLRTLGNAGGMSGAAIWQVESGEDLLCLRRWPQEHPTAAQLAWIHQQLQRAVAAGCRFVPAPRSATDGSTFVRRTNHLWELTPWLPGRADYRLQPSPTRLAAALQALAQLHQAIADPAKDRIGPSPGLEQRWQRLRTLSPQNLNALGTRVDLSQGPAIADLARRVLRQLPDCLERSAAVIGASQGLATPLQPCLRDVWHDHLLFDGERVTGIIDFGAMRVESPAGDVARLLGSLTGNDGQGWQTGLRAYQAIRPMTRAEHRLLAAFDVANITLAGLNWVQWLFVEGRQFEDRDRIEGRLQEICHRLEQFSKQAWPFTAGL